MVKVFPFSGIYYNQEKIKKLSAVLAPPYDIINPQEQGAFYQQHDFNVIRLILGKEFSGDNEYNNRYVRAAAFLQGWLRHRILLTDEKPGFYAYEQSFSFKGKRYVRLGFIGLLRLEELGRGKVFPHEETYPKAKLDRLQIMRATNANLESIFAIFSDEKNKLAKLLKSFTKRKPLLEAKDQQQVLSRVWRIDRKPAITKIIQEMKDKVVFIADGHHRYEAAINYRNELKVRNTKFTEDEAYNHVMMCFLPLEDQGLIVLPIHRVISGLNYFEPTRFLKDLEEHFEISPYPASARTVAKVRKKLLKDLEKAGGEKHSFALYLGKHQYYLLTLRDEKALEVLIPADKPKAWKSLDVTILHYLVFDRLLSIAQQTEDKVTYFKEVEAAEEMVDKKGAVMAFFLNPTRLEEITAIASKLEKLPHKSTYFYPKLLSGLLINHFNPNEKIS